MAAMSERERKRREKIYSKLTAPELAMWLIRSEVDLAAERERVKTLKDALGNLRAIVPAGMMIKTTDDKVHHAMLYQIQFGVCKSLLDGTNAEVIDIVDDVGRGWFRKLLETPGDFGAFVAEAEPPARSRLEFQRAAK